MRKLQLVRQRPSKPSRRTPTDATDERRYRYPAEEVWEVSEYARDVRKMAGEHHAAADQMPAASV